MSENTSSQYSVTVTVILVCFLLSVPVFFLNTSASTGISSITVKTIKSTSWAGYAAVLPKTHKVVGIATYWKIPSATCNPKSQYMQWVQMAVGIDGVNGVNPQYAGLEVFCLKGSSTPIADMFDSTGKGYGVFAAGDIVSAYVRFNSTTGTFSYNLQDFNDSFSATDNSAPGQVASLSDVEVINTLVQGCTTASGFCPQTHYAKLETGSHYTSDACAVFFPAPCVFLKNANVLYPLGHLPSGTTYHKYEMISDPGGSIIALPSAFATDHASFTVTFKGAGP